MEEDRPVLPGHEHLVKSTVLRTVVVEYICMEPGMKCIAADEKLKITNSFRYPSPIFDQVDATVRVITRIILYTLNC